MSTPLPRRRYIARPLGLAVIPIIPKDDERVYVDLELHDRIMLKGLVSDKRHLPSGMERMKRGDMEDMLELIVSITGAIDGVEHLMHKLLVEKEGSMGETPDVAVPSATRSRSSGVTLRVGAVAAPKQQHRP